MLGFLWLVKAQELNRRLGMRMVDGEGVMGYVIIGFAAGLGAVAAMSIGLLLARRAVLSFVVQAALAVASGVLVTGLVSGSVGYALYHRVYVPPDGMDETGAAVIFLMSLLFGSASALFFGLSTVLWERMRKK